MYGLTFRLIATFAVLCVFAVCYELKAQSSVPVVSSISPDSARAGSASLTITVTGSGFNNSSSVRVNDESLPTTFVDSATLRSIMPDNRLTTPAALSVVVFNADTSLSSGAVVFSVYSPLPPTVTSISPSAGLRDTTETATVTGTNLIGAKVSFSGSGVSAIALPGNPTSLPLQISIGPNAPFGSQSVTISTPSGSTTVCGLTACTFSVVDSGSWVPTGTLHDFRQGAAIVKLLDGRVLIAGGSSIKGTITASAELLDPSTGEWSPTGSMNVARWLASASMLPDGRILVAGGNNRSSSLSSAEIYDPATGTWSVAGFMSVVAPPGTAIPTRTLLLASGKVLVLHDSFGGEIFDLSTGLFQPAAGSAFPPSNGTGTPANVLLADGRVLLITGSNNGIYDPITTTLSSVPSLGFFNTGPWSRLLADGRVLVRGAYFSSGASGILSNYAFLYDVQANTAVPVDPRTGGSDVLLSSGLVLIAGGASQKGFEAPILYDSVANQVIPVPEMDRRLSSYFSQSAILLDDGRALLVGWDNRAGNVPIDVFAEIYTPAPYSNPSPAIGQVSASNPASASDFISLDIRGGPFLPNSSVRVGTTKLVTIYLGSQRLVAFVPPSLRASLNSAGVTVTNPTPGGGTTNPVPVGFQSPPPTITSVSPNIATSGTTSTITVLGQNLANPTSVSFSGTGVTATVQTGNDSNALILSVSVAADATLSARTLTIVTAAGTATLPNALVIQRSVPVTPPLPIDEVEKGTIRSGYVIITPDAGNAAPLTTLTFGMVNGGIVQSQAAILPVSLTSGSSVQVDVVQAIGRNLGLAIANPGGTAATITLTLRNEDGIAVGSPVSIPIPSAQQSARFVTELFPSSTIGPAFRGSIDIQSSAPVSLTGLRFSGAEFSTIPILANSAAGIPARALTAGQTANTPLQGTVGGPNAVMFSQFAMSGRWATELGLVNITASTINGRIDIFDTAGNPMAVKLNGATQSTFTYSIAAKGTVTLAPRDVNGQSPF